MKGRDVGVKVVCGGGGNGKTVNEIILRVIRTPVWSCRVRLSFYGDMQDKNLGQQIRYCKYYVTFLKGI